MGTVASSVADGGELVEEYDIKTGELLVRKRRLKTTTGRESDWEYLVGSAPTRFNPEQGLLVESSQNPIFFRQDARDAFQWRIRNLPYPADVYAVSIDHNERKLVVRTSNRKYFKKWAVPELDMLSLPLQDSALTWSYANTTLVISYAKPMEVLQAEAQEMEENKKLRAQTDGDVDCKQQ